MRGFDQIARDLAALKSELDDIEALLQAPQLRERKDVAPFFKSYRQIVATLGLFHSNIARRDRVSTELSIFGDFVCDAASGDSVSNSSLLVEFEDANPFNILNRVDPGKVKSWSSKFEHGASQLLDWKAKQP
jgi:hypothetical protein